MLLVIASFVFFFTPDMSMGGSSKADLGSINGRRITPQQYLNAQKEAMLTHFFRYQDWPRAGSMAEQMGWKMEEQIMQRLLLDSRLKEMNIIVGDEAVAKQVAQLFRSASAQASVKDQYTNFVENRLKPQGITDEDFQRFIRHELGIQQLGSLLSASGRLLTPAVAEAAYRFDNQRVETKAVVFTTSNFMAKAKVDIDPKALSQYYSNQVNNYNLPTRVQVSYVAFESINYLVEAGKEMAKNTNLNVFVDQQYIQRGTNTFKDDKGLILSAEAAKNKIRDEVRTQMASHIAQQKAYEFATELQEIEPVNMANLATLAGKKGLKIFETEPFSALDGPKGIKNASQFSQQAFGLNREQPFGPEPVQSGDDFYVLGFKNRLPSVPQPFEVVKDKVKEDYIRYRAAQLAREAGDKFAGAVTNGLAAGKKFMEIAKAEKVNVLNLSAFGRSASSIADLEAYRISPFQYRSAAFAHKAGESSGFISSGEGGFVLYVDKFLPADETKMKAEMKEYLDNLRSRQANIAFNEWLNSQIQSAGLTSSGSQ